MKESDEEETNRVDGELGGDAAEAARQEPGRARDLRLVVDVVPVTGEEAFLYGRRVKKSRTERSR